MKTGELIDLSFGVTFNHVARIDDKLLVIVCVMDVQYRVAQREKNPLIQERLARPSASLVLTILDKTSKINPYSHVITR